MKKAKIVLIGSGNVATHLGNSLKRAGHTITQVISKSHAHAESLASVLDATPTSCMEELFVEADFYLLAISDHAIEEVASEVQKRITTGMVLHTSGSTEMEVLRGSAENPHDYGVLYPLQTFSKQKQIDLKDVPFALEASDPQTLISLQELANTISNHCFLASSKQRQSLHIAAVFACNFTNYLYTVAEEILEEQNLNFDLIKPLIAETAQKALLFSPKTVQTGPAIRRDTAILTKHINFLQENPLYSKLYSEISRQIMKCKPEKEC